MDVYYDSEFIDTGRLIEPISIGFHREDGEELYRVFNDEDTIRRAVNTPWLRENVVPSLPLEIGKGPHEGNWGFDLSHPDFECVKSSHEIKQDVEAFLFEAACKSGLTLWAWYAAYDMVLLAQIWGKLLDIPSWMPMNTCDLRQEHLRLGEPILPRQQKGHHNALADARHNVLIHERLREVERSRMPGSPRACYNPDCEVPPGHLRSE